MTAEPSPERLAGDELAVAVDAAAIGPRALAARAAVPGIAAVGHVVATGPDATHLQGVRVLIGPHLACGECEICRRAGVTVCPAGRTLGVDHPGTVVPRVVGRARWALPLDGTLDVPGAPAALIGAEAALAFALYARAGVGPRDPAVVCGDGPIARLTVEVLLAKRIAPILATVDDDLAAWARARDVVTVRAGIPAELAAALAAAGHGARPARLLAAEDGAAHALAAAGPRATVAIAALAPVEPPGAALAAALAREVTVIGVRGAHPDLLPEVAALAIRGELDLAGAAEVIPAAELAAALTRPARARALVVA